MYQVVVTEPDGNVHGKTFLNPFEAVMEFGKYLAEPRFERKGQVMFQKLGQLVCTLDNYRLTYATILKTTKDQFFVDFYSLVTLEEIEEKFKAYASRYVEGTDCFEMGIAIQLRTQKLVLAFNGDKVSK